MKKITVFIGVLSSLWGMVFAAESAVCRIAVEHEAIYEEQNQPVFILKTEEGRYDRVNWQVSIDPDFKEEFPIHHQNQQYETSITLPRLESNNEDPYYFRVQGVVNDNWEEWSQPYPFFVTTSFQQAAAPAVVLADEADKYHAVPYTKPPTVSDAIWDQVQPYLLPLDHDARPILDTITQKTRITANQQELINGGFKILRANSKKKMIVASHPQLKGYLIKIYLDHHNLFKQEGLLWKRRVEGARLIQSTIDKHKYNHLFKVPKKWIYPLHLQPQSLRRTGVFPKNFILLVEDMQIYDRQSNIQKYQTIMTREILDALYKVVTEDMLFDSLFLDNIPFCKDGKIAFIDTEYFNAVKKTIKYEKLNKYLSKNMKKYWMTLPKKKNK